MNLFVLIPGMGDPHWAEKSAILARNMAVIRRGPWKDVEVHACVYTPGRRLEVERVVAHYGPGIVGDFLLRHCRPDDLQEKGFTHVLLLLDDVELQDDVDWCRLLRLYDDLALDIASPSMTPDSKVQYDYMVTKAKAPHGSNADAFLVNACEMFCYLMDLNGLRRYYRLLDADNPWLWGIDLVLVKHGRLRVALMNKMTMRHHYKGEGYALAPHRNPHADLVKYLEKYGETTATMARLRPYRTLIVLVD
jgi:hypothetical protein